MINASKQIELQFGHVGECEGCIRDRSECIKCRRSRGNILVGDKYLAEANKESTDIASI